MPTVLHVLPADATLSCPGLEGWLGAGAGFTPLVVAPEPGALPGHAVLPLPQAAGPWFKPLARLLPREASPWVGFLREHRVAVIHLHDVGHLAELRAAADREGIPLVLSWPRGTGPDVPFQKADRLLVGSLAQRDRLIEAGCPEPLLAVAPMPVARTALPTRRAPAKGQPVRWISAALAVETQSLSLSLEAFLIYRGVSEAPATLTVLTTPYLAAEAAGLIAELGLAEVVSCQVAGNAEAMRQAFQAAHLGLFPLEPADPDLDVGLTGPAWLAASTGLPLVLGPEGETDGFRDGQEAMVAELDPGSFARKMHFLAQRPFAWPNLGQQAALYATGAVDYQQACQVPYQVYKELLRAATV